MQALLMAALLAVVLLSRIQEPRRFGNGVLLGLIGVCAALGTVSAVGHFSSPAASAVTAAVAGAVWLSGLVAAALLVANGVTMVRREGTRPASLLALLAGAALLALLALLLSATYLSVRALRAAAGAAVLLGGYGAFLLLCFLGYTLLYRRLARGPAPTTWWCWAPAWTAARCRRCWPPGWTARWRSTGPRRRPGTRRCCW